MLLDPLNALKPELVPPLPPGAPPRWGLRRLGDPCVGKFLQLVVRPYAGKNLLKNEAVGDCKPTNLKNFQLIFWCVIKCCRYRPLHGPLPLRCGGAEDDNCPQAHTGRVMYKMKSEGSYVRVSGSIWL